MLFDLGMPADEKFEESVIKDNLFHRRLSDVRNSSLTDEHMTALEELNKPIERTMFSEPEPEKRRLTMQDVERIAFWDDSSPTYNFRYLMRKLEREMRRSKRYNRPLSVCMVGFKGFSRILQDHGPGAYDLAVFTSGEMLNEATRMDVDMVARYGDDRFIVVLPETPGRGSAILADRVRKKFEVTPIDYKWFKLYPTASVGIAYFPGLGT
ncbi:MAG: GGDEF domain-containing protein, partial [Candidatus Obscuribacterales bacterium]|nr:GGDEF domain-containing protein [Candidatus Obscuribacterales bacterium]